VSSPEPRTYEEEPRAGQDDGDVERAALRKSGRVPELLRAA
jgi:hypothetical protein